MEILAQILQRLNEIEAKISAPKISNQEHLTPKEACQAIGISRTKYEQLKRDGYIKDYKLTSGGRKRYVKRSEISQLFPKDFVAA
ncbi:hypothetical protein EMA8858_02331 [Emticicia aquatica]|uniref:DNA-binding protein n=1 Tax=Emticicia aquatica TaxID=1681835 RepID=A0ABN8EW75_9BACT|nr:hypothetical protein [Emticicia aquatica]CAH0996201.1 hypothetical protein EMA8858_02331 [Emticicia aquatica]